MLKKLIILLFLATVSYGTLTIERVESKPPLHLRLSNGTLSGFIDTASDSPNRTGVLVTDALENLTENAFSSPTSTFNWAQENNAFRVGFVDGTQWTGTNLGAYSAGFGRNTIGSGDYSMVWGLTNTASGQYSTAWGDTNIASGPMSTSWGYQNQATGNQSTSWGYVNVASGTGSTVWGILNTSTNNCSTAFGRFCDATGLYSTAWGFDSNASGAQSTAVGVSITNAMDNSFAIGYNQIDFQVSAGLVDCKSSKVVIASLPPAEAGSSGTAGTVTWDEDYLYVCVATDTWKRTGLTTWTTTSYLLLESGDKLLLESGDKLILEN